MSQESLTLYKLMVLYMLDQLDFPLTNSQLSEFFVSHGYTSYFHLQQSVNELAESGFIQGRVNRNTRNTTSYHLTESGTEAINLFEHKISGGIKDDILNYFKRNNYELRREVDITADYFPTKNGEYMVNTQIKEKDSLLLEMNINVVTREQATTICDQWSKLSEDVYSTVMKLLLLNAPVQPDAAAKSQSKTGTGSPEK